MKYALIDNTRTEATKGAKGICPICSSEVIAKCGDKRLDHWAHKGKRNCDPWWENETAWHRDWKDNFSPAWQEIIFTDEVTGEKHIADVQTPNGLVIEFQHSHINTVESVKREQFYKKMIWIIDCTRLVRDSKRFKKHTEQYHSKEENPCYIVQFPDECFPASWLKSKVPVVFDFKGIQVITDTNDWRNYLYFLYPNTNMLDSTVVKLQREPFIESIITGILLKEEQEAQKKELKPQMISSPIILLNHSQYFYDRGKLIRRRRL